MAGHLTLLALNLYRSELSFDGVATLDLGAIKSESEINRAIKRQRASHFWQAERDKR